MQNGVPRPARLIIIKIVLGKTAHVEHAEMRIHAWPRIRRRLAAIIKSRPDETAAQPRTVGEITPPTLRRLCSSCIVSADITALRVILVDASRGDRAGLFRADF